MITYISLAIAVVTGITLLLQYLLGDKRRIRRLREELNELEGNLRKALATNDTAAVSIISINLERLRLELGRSVKRK